MIRKSFRVELFLCFALVALVPLVISCFFLFQTLKARIMQDYEKKAGEQLKSMENTMVEFFGQAEETLQAIMEDKTITDGIAETDSWLRNKAYKKLYEKTENFRSVAQFDIYDAAGTCVFSTSSEGLAEDLPAYWGILKVARAHPEETALRRVSEYSMSEESCLQGAKAIMDEEQECLGFVVIDITEEHFETLLQGAYDEQNGIAVLDSYWEDVYSTREAKEESLAQTLRARRMAGESLKQPSDEVTFYISPIAETGLFLVLGRETVFTRDMTNMMIGVIVMMAVFSMLFCLIVAGVMSNSLTEPIKRLTQAMHQVENGDLDVQIKNSRQDELGQLSASFEVMTKELKEGIALQMRNQEELNDSNIAMMHAQLNPHFLYNTLDTIKWVAKANHVPEIATLSSRLARILRTSISEKKFIPLAEEVSLVTAYMDIQKIRFDGNFSYDVELPAVLEDCIVPKLIVQPIVENAVLHGLKEKKDGHVFLNIYEEGGDLCIDVEDNGCGMSKEALELLQKKDREALKGHIGFYNVDTILRLHFGEQYGLYAENLKTGGARVRIRLPLRRELEKSDV